MSKRFINSVIRCLLLIGGFLANGCANTETEKLTIATAANMQFVMSELTTSFERETGIPCDFIVGSSGKLTAQIKEGAPFDLFVSADMKYPMELYNSNNTGSEPEIFAYGSLVLWTMHEGIEPSIENLTSEKINHIGLANPKTAPYGQAAVEVIEHYKLMDTLKNKLAYGESISQTNQFIVSKAADVGFTAKSVVLSPQMKNKGHWTAISANLHSPIAQGVIVLKNRESQIENAKRFQDFLLSEKSNKILIKFGYSLKN